MGLLLVKNEITIFVKICNFFQHRVTLVLLKVRSLVKANRGERSKRLMPQKVKNEKIKIKFLPGIKRFVVQCYCYFGKALFYISLFAEQTSVLILRIFLGEIMLCWFGKRLLAIQYSPANQSAPNMGINLWYRTYLVLEPMLKQILD